MSSEITKTRNENQFSRAAFELSVLKNPGGVMRNKNRIQASLQRRIDVAPRAISNHPAIRFDDFELLNDALVRGKILFRHNFDGFKIARQPGTFHLGGLRGSLALAQQDQPMAPAQIGEGFRDAIENVRWSALEVHGHFLDFLNNFLAGCAAGELQIGVLQGTAKGANPIAVLENIAALGFIEDVSAVFGRVTEVPEAGEKAADGLLEENIIFPERVVSVDQYGLPSHNPFARP